MAEPGQSQDLAEAKPAPPKAKGADWWLKEIARSRKAWQTYRERAGKVIKRYRDERGMMERSGANVRFNILYANVETLRPAIYSHLPNPDVRRRHATADPVGREAATVLQRSLVYSCEQDLDPVLASCVQDYVLPGFAVARAAYKARVEGEAILDESAPVQYVGWDRFAMSRSPEWERVWWVAFLEELTRDEFIAAFGEEAVGRASFAYRDETASEREVEDGGGKARVWEVWDKRAKQRFFVAEGGQEFVRDPEDDPLHLESFFPCTRPVWAIATTGDLVPVPEYLEYQDLAIELDDVTQRIHVLTGALRRRGFYDGSLKDQLANVGNLGDNQFEPVEDWARFMDKGGIERVVAEMPLAGIVAALNSLYDYRDRLLNTIYQVTGMADIIRGASNPQETATAQQIKGRYAGLRIGEKQAKFQNLARDLVRLKAEIIAEHFQLATLQQMSGVELLTAEQKAQVTAWQQMAQAQAQQAAMMAQQAGQQPPAPPQPPPEIAQMMPLMAKPSWEDVLAVLRSDKLRGFKVDIETDSTIQPNADEERQQRIDLLTSVTGFLGTSAPLVQQGMLSADLVRELALFGIRSFKTAPTVEAALEQIGAQAPIPPHIQQAQAQLQQAMQQLQMREAKVHEAEMAAAKKSADAQLAAERAMRQESEAKAAQRLFDAEVAFQKALEAQAAKHDQELRRVAEAAESAVEEAVRGLSAPGVKVEVEPAEAGEGERA